MGSSQTRDLGRVLIATAGEAHDEVLVFGHLPGELHGVEDRVRAFHGGEDAFALGQGVEAGESVAVFAAGVGDAAGVFPVAVFGADAGIVETGGNGVNVARLAVFVLHDVAVAAVQNAGQAVG